MLLGMSAARVSAPLSVLASSWSTSKEAAADRSGTGLPATQIGDQTEFQVTNLNPSLA